MEEDAIGTTCQGVLTKKVTWGYDYDKTVSFYAPETKILEIKRWAFQNINFNPAVNSNEKARLETLKKDLYTVASAFIMAGINGGSSRIYFKEAGIKLSEIADGLPINTKLLDEAVEQIVVNKGIKFPAGTAESLIYQTIGSSADWRVPSYLYK